MQPLSRRANIIPNKTCSACRTDFTAKTYHHKYCSPRCARKQWKKDNPEIISSGRLRSTYGITLEQRDLIIESQGGCAICGTLEPKGLGWVVDHCHDTGRIRGVLCAFCNSGIGYFADDCDRLVSAAAYLLQQSNLLETESSS